MKALAALVLGLLAWALLVIFALAVLQGLSWAIDERWPALVLAALLFALWVATGRRA